MAIYIWYYYASMVDCFCYNIVQLHLNALIGINVFFNYSNHYHTYTL